MARRVRLGLNHWLITGRHDTAEKSDKIKVGTLPAGEVTIAFEGTLNRLYFENLQ